MITLKKTSEQQLQKKIINQLEKEGYLVLKLIKCNKNGYPDLLAVKHDKTIFIEVKRLDGKLSELQKVRINELRLKGIEVKVWTDFNKDFLWKQ